MNKFLFCLPRALAVIMVLYFASFISAGFAAESDWMDSLIHLVVAVLSLGMALIAWKWPLMGGLIYILFGAKYFLLIFTPGNLPASLVIGSVFTLTGLLFMWEGYGDIRRKA